MIHKKKTFCIALVFAIMLSLSALAQAQQSTVNINNIPNFIGVVGGVAPDYKGSDDYQGAAAPFFRWTFDGQYRYVQLLATELFFNVLDNENFSLGPVLNYRFERDDDVDDDVVKNMTPVDDTLELGMTASYVWIDQANSMHRFIVSVEGLGDVGDEYRGWLAMVDTRYWYPINKRWDFMIGLGATYSNSQFMSTYFGVSSTDAATTGLSFFDAGSGVMDINVPVSLVYHYSRNWHFIGGVKYFRLLNDAEDSPVTDIRGSANQVLAGLGIAYSW